jgi:hypothetical protein
MATDSEWFVTERVTALATVLLTRRKDIAVHQMNRDSGYDLLVELKDQPWERRFAVVLRGAKAAVDEAHANKVLRPFVKGFLRRGQRVLPVCLFFFTMEDDKGYYTWLIEPVQKDNRFTLQRKEEPDAKLLNSASLDQILERVNKWYDSLIESGATWE